MERNLSGGRCLNVIWQSANLNSNQKLILFYLTSQMKFKSEFREQRWPSINTLCKATQLSRSTLFRELNALERDGYLERTNRFIGKAKTSSLYSVTDKLFEEGGSVSVTPGSSNVTPPQCQDDTTLVSDCDIELPHGTPALELPQETFLPAAEAAQKIVTKNEFSQKRQEREACEIIASMVAHDGFINVKAINGAAKAFLERFGIETLRAFREEVMTQGKLGVLKWDANKFYGWLEDFHLPKGC